MQPTPVPLMAQTAHSGRWPLRRKLRALWLVVVTAIFCTLPLLLVEMQKQNWDNIYKAWFLAGLACVLTWTVTLYEVALHLEYFSCPPLQRHIIRILLMPPIYALDSWLCLRFNEARTTLTPIRELYEAYTIYNFFMYLNRYLEAQLGPVQDYMANNATSVPHIWPINCLSNPWVGRETFRRCRSGVLNYVIVRPATAIIMWLTLMTSPERYEEGSFSWENLWPYCMIINNFSQCWALYVLMLFYLAVHNELKPLNPFRKFVTIKLVVFASFWQGLAITLLAAFHVLKPMELRAGDALAAKEITGGLQDFLICIEMFFSAVGFAWAFPPRDYMTGEPPGFWQSFYVLFDLTDVMDDVQDRVHEEYREITTQPIQKIIAPLRNNPLFSKPIKSKPAPAALSDQGPATELVPLVGASSSDSHLLQVPHVTTSLTGSRSMCGEVSTSTTRASGAPPFQPERAENRAADNQDVGFKDSAGSASALSASNGQSGTGVSEPALGVPAPLHASSSSSAAPGSALYAKAALRGPSRTKLQSHVD